MIGNDKLQDYIFELGVERKELVQVLNNKFVKIKKDKKETIIKRINEIDEILHVEIPRLLEAQLKGAELYE